MFNYLPIQLNKLRHKNDSNDMTFIMNSNTRGTKNDKGFSLVGKIAENKISNE